MICLIKGAFVGDKNFERYQNARNNNKKYIYYTPVITVQLKKEVQYAKDFTCPKNTSALHYPVADLLIP